MKTLNIHEAETQLLSILLEIKRTGEAYLIYRDREPIAELSPYRRKNRLIPHPVMSQITIDYDPTEPLSQNEWPEEEEHAA
ncbi:Prevent-host-death protein [Candidatus Vecturithrix granuli]|uniref:Prevent-host-death protein n=1 Tax=Vecturithrix granuli TaxID=1499967 RepID=A0A081C308_VECG1|nr:Prevent-host-death protein [Candidatus Vecturithrix granuli]